MFQHYNFKAILGDKHINITEKPIPTNESIKLFQEMKEKAYNSIIDSMEVQNNILNFNVILYKDWDSKNDILKAKVLLNEREINLKIKATDTENIMEYFYEEISKEIAKEIILKTIGTNKLT